MGSDKVLTHPAPLMSVKLEGPLTKWTNVVQGWQYRWFVLDENTCLLSYYTSKDKMMKGARRGCLRLKGGKIGINDEDDSTFTITCDHRTFHFQARDSDERTRWVQCLEEVILKHSNGPVTTSNTALAMEEELNRRMQEAEGYFRLVTDQAKNLELKLNQPNKVKTERSVLLKDSLTQMIETMGQTIELLHTTKQSLAKKVPVPVIHNKTSKVPYQNGTNGLGSTPSVVTLDSDHSPDSETQGQIASDIDNISINQESSLRKERQGSGSSGSDNVETAGEVDVGDQQLPDASKEVEEVEEEVMNAIASIPMHLMSIANATVPTSSYTSSDEEDMDEFFDAPDEFEVDQIASTIKMECDKNVATVQPTSENTEQPMIYVDEVDVRPVVAETTALQVQIQSPEGEGDDEWDVERDTVGEEDTDMQAHGSVITHLLSQVRIGMDLTKVTLPTFILERRSLLEMYADFFGHPDIFKGIPDKQSPGERMVEVLKWYMSTFYAGRKSDVAKKPYNPILGEIFQCFYDMTDAEKSYGENNYGSEPVPWSSKSDVSILAEQVSHHPPISAFYAECQEKNMCFNGHIWTKSKFLGLSIGVHHVGSSSLFLLDHDEEYVLTFPNGYGRSILTVPWVELGGKTEIACKKTGYTAQVEFHTKPFYGGKKNRITADVYRPEERKPFLNVTGEWNGVMFSKHPDAREPEIFFDTQKPTHSKRVRALGRQESFESRAMWQHVTRSLIENNIEGATAGKHKLEEIQRQDARMRKETNTKWVTRFFDEEGEGEERKFHYKRPLYTMLGRAKPGS